MTKTNKTNLSDDVELIKEYKHTKNKEIVGELFKRYSGFCFTICIKYYKNKQQAEDAVLTIFSELIDKLLIHEVSNFKSWLHTVTRNHCLLNFREQKQEQVFLRGFAKNSEIFMENNDDLHQSFNIKDNKFNKLEECLANLKQEQKICIELFFLQNKSYIETAELTGFNLKEVKSFLQNGKRNLKICLEKK